MLATRLKTTLLALLLLPLSFSLGSFAGLVLGGFTCLWFFLDQSLKQEEQAQRESRRAPYPSRLPSQGTICWNVSA